MKAVWVDAILNDPEGAKRLLADVDPMKATDVNLLEAYMDLAEGAVNAERDSLSRPSLQGGSGLRVGVLNDLVQVDAEAKEVRLEFKIAAKSGEFGEELEHQPRVGGFGSMFP
jgi:hypothetical protein